MSYDAQRLIGWAFIVLAVLICVATVLMDAWDRSAHARHCKVPNCIVCGVRR